MERQPITARTRELLSRHQIALKKSLGQNFLTDAHVIGKIIRAAELDEETGVIEIGPGIGALTERLAESAGGVVAVELDDRLVPILREQFLGQSRVSIVHGDAMKVDFRRLIGEHLNGLTKYAVVANLPYYITSPILMRLLEERLPLSHIVVMIQKEVAERLRAKPGTKDYGSLTVAVQYFAEVSWVATVPRHVFVPRPNVDSAVIRLSVRPEPAVQVRDEALFFRVVRAAFNQRRKTLSNALSTLLSDGKNKEALNRWLEEAGIDPRRRGETLSLEEFARLADGLAAHVGTKPNGSGC
ncbi:16S rRNA (adenine(1518)-N(6)/adenine(1519)-N(6))-dimethyltransferase RsmA [Polycladomyces subterraneus]|uniref:Ribosomal RNA small subunit methyltransferase A n=1 Tax=Polycladomyces subterraneus TaxID=1016997 RepID=A0ABT8IKZ8_9BACL|nr:16S rRNA (adenine(1518)-N(6)/adenine(1519)-N(6))-dimethyltransferase RsmA [Polycladomyces subterraneus]MDN4593463.1 16S rRNA (adenine(1518)-N(6)/adenine(1519)-N(6))-dimethyltransferase RsmA [Polycladomyces subterraneus]